MAIGVQNSSGTDFDDLFERRQSGDPLISSNTNVQAQGGTELRSLYCPASMGSLVSSNTGVQSSAGTDCRSLFAAKGSVVRWNGSISLSTTTAFTTSQHPSSATAWMSLLSNGNISGGANSISGSWSASGANSSNTEVRFVHTSGPAPTLNQASSWVSLSSSRRVEFSRSALGQATCFVRIEIRNSVNTSLVDTQNIQLSAQVQSFGDPL